MHNIDTMLVTTFETTLNQRCATSMQPFFNLAQCRFKVDMTLSQRCFNVASTSVKATSKPILLVKSMDLQKIDILYSNY